MEAPRIKLNLFKENGQKNLIRPREIVLIRRAILPHAVWFWKWSATWPWYSGLLATGFSIIALNEYAIGVFLALLSAFGLVSKLLQWKDQRTFLAGHKTASKIVGSIGIVLGFIAFAFIVNDERGSKPWSHLQVPAEKFLASYLLTDDALQVPALPKKFRPPIGPPIEKTARTYANATPGAAHKIQLPSVIQVTPSYGNLKQRTLQLADRIDKNIKHRNDQLETFYKSPTSGYSKDGNVTRQGYEEWMRSNDAEYRHCCLAEVQTIHDEFVSHDFRDTQLDQILNEEQEINEAFRGGAISPKQRIPIRIEEMKEVSESLRVLANQLPSTSQTQ
jgi:hypothetical protein